MDTPERTIASLEEYILNIGRLLGCMDGDDTPPLAIERLKARAERAEAILKRLLSWDKFGAEFCETTESEDTREPAESLWEIIQDAEKALAQEGGQQ